ncbi:MAG: stage II sporulation protein R, partial [Clostridia bacterium]|nr:stage II sporulation protein R [Clostridia bacterium]
MKKLILPIISILAATLVMAAIPTEADGAIYEDTVRLHILANSDSEEDQALKLALRDEILREYGKTLSVFENIDDACRELTDKRLEIQDFADRKIRELGYVYTTAVTLTEEWYDTRDYGDFSLPCGYYTSLQII